MKKLLIAATLLIGFAGVSIAQTAPVAKSAHTKTHAKGMHKHSGKHTAHAKAPAAK